MRPIVLETHRKLSLESRGLHDGLKTEGEMLSSHVLRTDQCIE